MNCSSTHGSCSVHKSCGDHKETKSTLLKVAILITRVALAALAIMTDAYLFLSFFSVGLGLGVYRALTGTKTPYQGSLKGCSNDLLEEMADVKFPDGFSLAISSLTFACHIEHHPLVFVPLIAAATGYWAGHQVVDGCKWMNTKVSKIQTPKFA